MLVGTLVLLPIILGYIVLRLLAVPRQGARRRELSLASVVAQAAAHRCGAVAGACGRITPQPMRSSGSRPWNCRSNARGTSGTSSGKLLLDLAAAACPRVSVAGQTTTAPFSAMSWRGHRACGLGRGRRRKGSAGSARRARPAPPASGRRRRPRAAGRCGARSCRRRIAPSRRPAAPTRRSTANGPRQRSRSPAPSAPAAAPAARSRHSRSDTGAAILIRSPAATITARPDSTTSGAAMKFSGRRVNSANRPIATIGASAKK